MKASVLINKIINVKYNSEELKVLKTRKRKPSSYLRFITRIYERTNKKQISYETFRREIRKKVKSWKSIPYFNDKRKFQIICYDPDGWVYAITNDKVEVLDPYDPIPVYSDVNGLTSEEYFNFALSRNIPECIKYDEVLYIRKAMKGKLLQKVYQINV